ncbi:MAG: hypothetical protein OEW87_15675, partial [Flavobacteriaceae bacterium]|nr:hypothetical protein [Flavobacteriaceae bacterium]
IKQTSQNYSDFTLFIVQSTLSDFKSFTKDGLLERYNKKTIYSNKDIKQLTALKKRLKYSAPWITLFLNDDKKKYAHKLNNLIIEFMHNLAIQSKLFSLHNKLGKNKDFPVIFSNIKLLSTTKTTQPEVKESEKSPKDIIKDLDTIPRPNPSKEIDQLMNKI